MPRRKTLSDIDVLKAAHRLLHERGPEALTFERLSRECGLSGSTLVQRFGTKAGLKRAALLHAWDQLDQKTATLASNEPCNPEGAIAMLKGLSVDYGGIEAYAAGLLVLREDFRDPVLRARGAAWRTALSSALEARFAGMPDAPAGIGLLLASQWQGALLWWGFEPKTDVVQAVEESLRGFLRAMFRPRAAGARPRT